MQRLDRYIGHTVLSAVALVLLVIVGVDAMSAFIDESGELSPSYTLTEVGLGVGRPSLHPKWRKPERQTQETEL